MWPLQRVFGKQHGTGIASVGGSIMWPLQRVLGEYLVAATANIGGVSCGYYSEY